MSISSRVSELAIAVRDKINEMVPRLLPRGGEAGQVLIKSNRNDFKVTWGNLPPAQVGTPSSGSPTASYLIWNSPSALTNWRIVHNLGKYPSVITLDSTGNQYWGGVSYPDINTVNVEFAYAFSGTAYLE